MQLKQNATILFIGDSVVESGRDKLNLQNLGYGYVSMFSNYLNSKYRDLNIKVINQGIGGNRCTHVLSRYKKDALDYNPDVVFLSCGVNDAWHKFDLNCLVETTDDVYRQSIEQIIQMTLAQNIKLVILESFLLNEPKVRQEYRIEFDPKMRILKELAIKYQLDFIELDKLLLDFAAKINSQNVCPDGIHPSILGHGIIANVIINHFNL